MTTTLVLGGVRSGKSRHAEHLLAGRPVTYVATSAPPTRPTRSGRTDRGAPGAPAGATGPRSRPSTSPVSSGAATGPVLVDCLGVWLSRLLDDIGWERPDALGQLAGPVEELLDAWTSARVDVVMVSNEVGWGVVPATAIGATVPRRARRPQQPARRTSPTWCTWWWPGGCSTCRRAPRVGE